MNEWGHLEHQRAQPKAGPPNMRLGGDPGGLKRWKETTPKVLQDAILAGWNGTASPQQKRLLKNWVTARVMGASIESRDLLMALLDSRERSTSTRKADSTGSGSTKSPKDSPGSKGPSTHGGPHG